MGEEPEALLPGGFVNRVVRIGDTARRLAPERAEFVRALLRYLEHCEWPGAPRYLGVDDQGREVLTYVDGHVAWEPTQPAGVRSEASLARAAQLLRQLHDFTAHSELAGGAEVVCHNDLSPKNTVYRDLGGGLRPVAFIDWDIAAPGARIHDVAHMCWQYVGLGPELTDTADAARLVRVIADSYGLADRTELVETILWWQDRCWRGIEAAADAGEPAMVRLRQLGTVRQVQAAHRWTAEHRHVFERELS